MSFSSSRASVTNSQCLMADFEQTFLLSTCSRDIFQGPVHLNVMRISISEWEIQSLGVVGEYRGCPHVRMQDFSA